MPVVYCFWTTIFIIIPQMTERTDDLIDLFIRQGLLSGNRVPIILGGHRNQLRSLHKIAGVEVGELGQAKAGMMGVPLTTSIEQAETLPWRTRFLNCDKDVPCNENLYKYNSKCWIDRPDVRPEVVQKDHPGGQASWHPGHRVHAIRGRAIAFVILMALKDALDLWSSFPLLEITDDVWHMNDYYADIRSKVVSMNDEDIPCLRSGVPPSFCRYPVHGRTEFSPRVKPWTNSLRGILKHADDYFPEYEPNVYDPPGTSTVRSSYLYHFQPRVVSHTYFDHRRLGFPVLARRPRRHQLPFISRRGQKIGFPERRETRDFGSRVFRRLKSLDVGAKHYATGYWLVIGSCCSFLQLRRHL